MYVRALSLECSDSSCITLTHTTCCANPGQHVRPSTKAGVSTDCGLSEPSWCHGHSAGMYECMYVHHCHYCWCLVADLTKNTADNRLPLLSSAFNQRSFVAPPICVIFIHLLQNGLCRIKLQTHQSRYFCVCCTSIAVLCVVGHCHTRLSLESL